MRVPQLFIRHMGVDLVVVMLGVAEGLDGRRVGTIAWVGGRNGGEITWGDFLDIPALIVIVGDSFA